MKRAGKYAQREMSIELVMCLERRLEREDALRAWGREVIGGGRLMMSDGGAQLNVWDEYFLIII